MSERTPNGAAGSGPNGGPNGPRRVVRPMPRLGIGRFVGVPVYFAPSWLIIAALLTVYYGPVVRNAVPGLSAGVGYLVALGYAVVFALCVLLHEMGHTAVSIKLGKPVRQIVIFLLGGVSEIESEPDRPRDEFLIAVAGPFVSAVLTGIAAAVAFALPDHSLGGVFAALLFWSNLIVVVFNLLPGLPLDGGRLLRALVWAVSKSQLTGTKAGAWTGRVIAVGVVAASLVLDRGEGNVINSFVAVLLAMYLWFGASQSLKLAQLMDRVPAIDVDTLLRPGLMVPTGLSIDAALQRLWQGNGRGLVIVDATDRPAAIVDEARVNAVTPDRRPWTSLDSVARPLEDGLVLRRGLSGADLLAAVRRTPATEYLVVDERGAPAGILAMSDIAAALGANA